MKKLTEKMLPDSGAEFSKDGFHRFRLWRTWEPEKPKCLWIMLNPSVADGSRDDATIRRVITFSKNFGYGGFFVGNLFSWISSDSGALVKYLEYISIPTHAINQQRNDRHLWQISAIVKPSDIIFAWGNKPEYSPIIMARSLDIERMFPKAQCLGLTSKNQPKHPVRLPNSSALRSYYSLKKYKQIKGL